MQRARLLLPPRCVLCGRRLSTASSLRAVEPATRSKVRTLPKVGEKPVLPPRPRPEATALPFQAMAAAQADQQRQEEWTYVKEDDVKQGVYTFEPASNPALFYVGVIFLFFLGVNVADAYRLDSLGSLSRPLLPAKEKERTGMTGGTRYIDGATYILVGTTALCAGLAYIPTRHVTTLTIVPRFPRPVSDQHRIAWYHHSDCIIHSTSDFIRLPFASFRKGKRSVGGQTAISSRTKPKRAGTIFLANDAFPSLTQYYLARPDAPNVKVQCDDILVLERALQYNSEVERQWKAREELKQKARV